MIVTLGHLPVDRWVHAVEFSYWREVGETLCVAHVEAGPLVRSSYHAEEAAVFPALAAETAEATTPAARARKTTSVTARSQFLAG